MPWSIALLALALRLVQLDLAPFSEQAARQLIGARELLQGTMPLHGITDVNGVTQPSLSTYLYAIPLLISRDPRWIEAFIGLLSVCALMLLYASTKRWFGTRTAIFGAVLWAVNPWANLATRTLTGSAFTPLVAALVFVGCELALNREQPTGWLLAWLCSWLLVNLSLYSWPALLFMGIISLAYWRRVRWPQVLLASSLGLLLLMPYFYYQSYVRFRDLTALALNPNGFSLWRGFQAVLDALRYSSSSGIAALAGSQRSAFISQRLPLAFIESATFVLTVAGGLVCLVRTVYYLLRWRERQTALPYFVLLTWVACCLVGLSQQPVRDGLLDLGLYAPGGMILLGCILSKCFGLVVNARLSYLVRFSSRSLLVISITGVLLWPIYVNLHLLNYVNNVTLANEYGLPLRFWRQTAESVRTAQSNRVDRKIYISGGVDGGLGSDAAQLRYLLPSGTELIPLCPEDGNCLVVPLNRPQLHLALQPSDQLELMLEFLSAREIAQATQPDTQYEARLFLVPPPSVGEITKLITTRDLVTVDDGLLFLGYDTRETTAGYLTTFWCFAEQEALQLPHGLAMRLYQNATTQAETRITVGISERYWTMDKVFIRLLPIPLVDPGTYQAQIASFRLPDSILNRTMQASTATAETAIELSSITID